MAQSPGLSVRRCSDTYLSHSREAASGAYLYVSLSSLLRAVRPLCPHLTHPSQKATETQGQYGASESPWCPLLGAVPLPEASLGHEPTLQTSKNYRGDVGKQARKRNARTCMHVWHRNRAAWVQKGGEEKLGRDKIPPAQAPLKEFVTPLGRRHRHRKEGNQHRMMSVRQPGAKQCRSSEKVLSLQAGGRSWFGSDLTET